MKYPLSIKIIFLVMLSLGFSACAGGESLKNHYKRTNMRDFSENIRRECLANKNNEDQCTKLHDCVLDKFTYSNSHFTEVTIIMSMNERQNSPPEDIRKPPFDLSRHFTSLRIIEYPGRYFKDYDFLLTRTSTDDRRRGENERAEFLSIARTCQASVGVPGF